MHYTLAQAWCSTMFLCGCLYALYFGAGVVFHCSKDVGAAAWDAIANSASMDFDGLDLAIAGIEPFSEVVLSQVRTSDCNFAGLHRNTTPVVLLCWCAAKVMSVVCAYNNGLPPVSLSEVWALLLLFLVVVCTLCTRVLSPRCLATSARAFC